MHSVIAGSGHYVPEKVVTNAEIAPGLATTAEWIEERTGIRERRFAAPEQAASHLAEHAARAAIEDASLSVDDLDAIIFATLSPDAAFPGSGVFLQRHLGLAGIPALDVRNQCTGFLYALSIADAWISTGAHRHVLVVGSEVHSAGLDFSQRGRSVTPLFGDGAGAVVLAPGDDTECGLLDVTLGADGSGIEALWCELPGSGARPHIDAAHLAMGRQFPQMQGRRVYRRAVETLERELRELFERHHIGPAGDSGTHIPIDDVLLVPHQANQRINETVAERVGLAADQVVHTIGSFGNTTAASLPMALDVARRDGRAHPGRMVVMAAFGSGFTWGTALLRL